jgi:hypothetical protein
MEGQPVTDIPYGSDEKIGADVECDVDLDMTVKIAIDRAADLSYTWLAADWVGTSTAITLRDGTPGFRRRCETTAPVTIAYTPKTEHKVYVQLTDTPEVPVMLSGTFKVV